MRVRRQKEYDPQKDWKERSSTGVAVIILTIVSIVLFTIGASMLFTWISHTEQEKRMNSEEQKTINAVLEHYGIQATYEDRCIKTKVENEKRYYIVVCSGRAFSVEAYDQDGLHIYNVEEIEQ